MQSNKMHIFKLRSRSNPGPFLVQSNLFPFSPIQIQRWDPAPPSVHDAIHNDTKDATTNVTKDEGFQEVTKEDIEGNIKGDVLRDLSRIGLTLDFCVFHSTLRLQIQLQSRKSLSLK